jgi:hypothetical protein
LHAIFETRSPAGAVQGRSGIFSVSQIVPWVYFRLA